MNIAQHKLAKWLTAVLLFIMSCPAYTTETDFYLPGSARGETTRDVLTSLKAWESAVERYQETAHSKGATKYSKGYQATLAQLSYIRTRATIIVDLAQSYRMLRDGVDQLIEDTYKVMGRATPSSPMWAEQVTGTRVLLEVLRAEHQDDTALSTSVLLFTVSQLLAGEDDKVRIRNAANDVAQQLHSADTRLAEYRSVLKRDVARLRNDLSRASD